MESKVIPFCEYFVISLQAATNVTANSRSTLNWCLADTGFRHLKVSYRRRKIKISAYYLKRFIFTIRNRIALNCIE